MTPMRAERLAPEAFTKYADEAAPDLAFIDEILGRPLPDGPEQLVRALREVEAWYGWTTRVLADADGFLDVAEFHALPEKTKDLTELDRQTVKDRAVAEQRAFRNRVDGLGRAINLRLMLGTSLLKHEDQERRSLGRAVGA